MQIRPFDFSEADYQAHMDVFNAAHPEAIRTVADVQNRDQIRTKDEVLGRFLAEVEGQVVGVAEYETSFNDPKPGVLEVNYRIHPEFKAYAPALWNHLIAEIDKVKPHQLKTRAREDWDEYGFYLGQGFEEFDRSWNSTLDVLTFDPAPFQRPLPEGICIQTLSDLPYSEEALQRELYDLEIILLATVPFAEPLTPWPFEVWLERVLTKNPYLLPEGYFVATKDQRLIGLSQLWKSGRPQTLQTGLTAVLPDYRRRGIALALKVKAAEFAKQYGAKYIRTGNHQVNRPMLAINEAMGFQKEPSMIYMRKELMW